MVKSQWRATYEDVLEDQEKLRVKLDILVRDGRCIKDEEERKQMFLLFGDALLGEERNEKIVNFVVFQSGRTVTINDFSWLIREICYQETSMIPLSFFEMTREKENIDIGLVWKAIRTCCFRLFPRALDKGIKMSKERDQRGVRKGGFTFGPQGKNITD